MVFGKQRDRRIDRKKAGESTVRFYIHVIFSRLPRIPDLLISDVSYICFHILYCASPSLESVHFYGVV
jgi:hypothetical protein